MSSRPRLERLWLPRTVRTGACLCLALLTGYSAAPSGAARVAQEESGASTAGEWRAKGRYAFEKWSGPPVGVHYAIPEGSHADTPILIVIPGAKRNADAYRDDWEHLAEANRFIVLALEATKEHFPDEYAYNAGGVVDESGRVLPAASRLDAVIEPLFDDFRTRYGSRRTTYALYGHSAGGGFVHRFLLFVPKARVDHVVAANPAFFTMPDEEVSYPFGLAGAGLADDALERWFRSRLVVMLGEKDVGPRSQPLSNGREANAQGPSVYARGLHFQQAALTVARRRDLELNWTLEVVARVGHSDVHMASHAVKHLFDE